MWLLRPWLAPALLEVNWNFAALCSCCNACTCRSSVFPHSDALDPWMVQLGSHSSDYGAFIYVMLEYRSNMDAENK